MADRLCHIIVALLVPVLPAHWHFCVHAGLILIGAIKKKTYDFLYEFFMTKISARHLVLGGLLLDNRAAFYINTTKPKHYCFAVEMQSFMSHLSLQTGFIGVAC